MITVSAIICSFNRRQYLKQAIDSVLSQDLSLSDEQSIRLKIYVGDDVSTDGSREMLVEYSKQYPDLFVLNFQKENSGLGYNWASTVLLSDGEFIASLDDDDYWHNPNKLKIQIDYMLQHPDVSVSGTDYRTIDAVTGKVRDVVTAHPYPDDLPRAIWNGAFGMLQSSTVIRRSDIDRYVNLSDFMNYHFTIQDWPCQVLLSRHTKFAHLPVVTTTYRIGGCSITNDKSLQKLENRLVKGKQMCAYLSEGYYDFDEQGYEAYFNVTCLRGAYRFHDFEGARKYGNKVGGNDIKVICSKNRILFELFCLLKKLKNLTKVLFVL